MSTESKKKECHEKCCEGDHHHHDQKKRQFKLDVAHKQFAKLGFPSAQEIYKDPDVFAYLNIQKIAKSFHATGQELLEYAKPLPNIGCEVKTGSSNPRFGKIREKDMHYLLEKRKLGLDTSELAYISNFECVEIINAMQPAEKQLEKLLRFLPTEDLKSQVKSDIINLSRQFAEIQDIKYIKVKFELKRKQSCPRYHVDYIPYRLLVTYAGPGTHYLTKGNSNPMMIPIKSLLHTPIWKLLETYRNWFIRRISHDEYNECALLPSAKVDITEPGDILILKGAAWEGCNGAVHRSPPVEEGEYRLVLTLDALKNVARM